MAAQPSSPEPSEMLAHRNWRSDWTAERTCLYWYLTFEDQPALLSLFGEVEEYLRRVASIDVVPPSWLHLTLLEVGFADEVTPSEMDDLVTAARSVTGLLPLALELGPITTMTDAVVLQVTSEQLVALQGRLAEGLRTSRAVEPDPDGFWPHVSLAYTNSDCLRDDVMGPLRGVTGRTTSLTVPRLTLAAVTREQDHYRWQQVTALTLEEESELGIAT